MNVYPVFIPHAGCPHRCIFCAQDRTTGQVAVPAADEVGDWLARTLPEEGDGEVAFYGGTFTQLSRELQKGFLSVARPHVAAGRLGGIRISTRPDAIDNRVIARLKASGVTTVELGCQSFSQEVLDASARGHSVADSLSAIRRCLDNGLHVGVQLMPGLPGGDAPEAIQSLRQALETGPSFVRIYPTVVIDGTALAEFWKAGGYRPWTLDDAVDVCADMLILCRRAGIPVIRLGLQQDPQLEANLLAGPYHPAFGQLVRSRIWRRAMQRAGVPDRKLSINPSELSDALGHRAENRAWFAKRGLELCLETDQSVARGYLRMSGRDLPLDEISSRGGQHD